MIDKLKSYMGAYDRYTLFALMPILAVPFILDLIFGLQPPWPKSTTYITAFLELAIIFYCFLQSRKSRAAMRRTAALYLTAMVALFAVYFTMYSLFVFKLPISGKPVVGGFICNREAAEIVVPAMGEHCPFVSEAVLAAAQYEVGRVWTPLSVKIVELSLFVCWSVFFMAATFLFGSFIAHVSSKRGGSRTK